jgi:peptidyl-prolyl cis-trans isomerase SurA
MRGYIWPLETIKKIQMKKVIIFSIATFCLTVAKAQTLFTYGNKEVTKDEFVKAFEKNPSADTNRRAALEEYLHLYINFKLKVQAAYDEKLNESEDYKSEAENFQKQLSDNAINEEANIEHLVSEAFERSKKDLQLSQVFIEVPEGKDTAEAYKKIYEAYTKLNAGKPFEEIASTFSTDSLTKKEKGKIGYITVFSLPYQIENIVYGLKKGSYSHPYHSKLGYHIFKVTDERPALGKRKVKQLLFPTPSFFTSEERKGVANMADSVYNVLQSGTPFEEVAPYYNNSLAESFGDAAAIEVSVGQYSSDFENQVFSLKKAGDISKPFTTSYGYHILKLVAIEPAGKDIDDVRSKAAIQQQVENDERLLIARKNLVKKWMEKSGYQPSAYNANELWAYTDSVMENGNLKHFKNISGQTSLFSFASKKVAVSDWINFLNQMQESNTAILSNPYPELMKEFINEQVSEYYRSHLQDYNPALKQQLYEFNEANLLFAIMDEHVWGKADDDNEALKKYYAEHKSEYIWSPGLSGIIITAPKKDIANELATKVKAAPQKWREITAQYNTVMTDSGRFEFEQLPIDANENWQKGQMTVPIYNRNDNSYSLICVTAVHPEPEQRAFEDARGMVINDYQKIVEERWVAELKKKYPVKVNRDVFESID